MRIISKKTLVNYWATQPTAKAALQAWCRESKRALWAGPSDVKASFTKASILKSRRVVFNILGNDFRLVVSINYKAAIVYIRFVGTHKEYDVIDADSV